ncbi:hypothetical protein [Reichenbachiella sp. MSK19-1]|uniref:hypothetical protein n=1 Tax=Reichenbachiella sp. MSK19-1 TaxID=1897631 RepID=UPI000E6BEB6C|nr:hypothetical protein [Reichenbachiella sp. MSK19-1]RJE70684.1 hypothetical protein BGP76_11430 [Reichenbachiella sp. MSK19-1]
MPKEKVLITVKTYPSISEKYDELVCTAGFREDGSWVRIYPVQFRKKTYNQQYSKYQWIEIDLVKNTSDFRKESYRPYSHETEIKIIGEIKPDGDDWRERRKIVLNKVYTNLKTLFAEAKDKKIGTSLAVFKPSKIHKLEIKEVDREWSKKKLEQMSQLNLFESENKGEFEVVKKLPYKFSYRLSDNEGTESTMMIEDWEIGQLFWNSLRRHAGDEKLACEDVRKKYIDDFARTKDLHLFLGTTKLHHNTAPNPFVIIGTFHPKPTTQISIF